MEVSLSVTFRDRELWVLSVALQVYADALEQAVADAPPLPHTIPNMFDAERAYTYEYARTLRDRIEAIIQANGTGDR